MPTATIQYLKCDRRLSSFMRNAGLGIESVGIRIRYNLKFKEGEHLTHERIMAIAEKVQKEVNEDVNLEYELHCPTVLEINN